MPPDAGQRSSGPAGFPTRMTSSRFQLPPTAMFGRSQIGLRHAASQRHPLERTGAGERDGVAAGRPNRWRRDQPGGNPEIPGRGRAAGSLSARTQTLPIPSTSLDCEQEVTTVRRDRKHGLFRAGASNGS